MAGEDDVGLERESARRIRDAASNSVAHSATAAVAACCAALRRSAFCRALTSRMMMLARIILLQPPAWQIALSVVLLAVAIYLSISFAARIFRVGILLYAKRPSLRELFHWYKLAK